MRSEDLAVEVETFIKAAQSRVMGIGDEQYSSGEVQKFEGMPIGGLFDWAEEELQDVANYACMLAIRLRMVRATLARFVDSDSPLPW